jgi:hypothetical protein
MTDHDDRTCNHRRCNGGPCKALAAEELQPTDADRALAVQLHDEGWIQTSAKYRHIRRWAAPPPSGFDMIAPEYRNTAWGRRAAAAIERFATSSNALHSEYQYYDVTLYPAGGPERKPDSYAWAEDVQPNPLIEERTLSPSEFKAYKAEQRKRDSGGITIVGGPSKSGKAWFVRE